jgi:hypothetical protein
MLGQRRRTLALTTTSAAPHFAPTWPAGSTRPAKLPVQVPHGPGGQPGTYLWS